MDIRDLLSKIDQLSSDVLGEGRKKAADKKPAGKSEYMVKGTVDGKTKVITVSAGSESEARDNATNRPGFKVDSVRKKGESANVELDESMDMPARGVVDEAEVSTGYNVGPGHYSKGFDDFFDLKDMQKAIQQISNLSSEIPHYGKMVIDLVNKGKQSNPKINLEGIVSGIMYAIELAYINDKNTLLDMLDTWEESYGNDYYSFPTELFPQLYQNVRLLARAILKAAPKKTQDQENKKDQKVEETKKKSKMYKKVDETSMPAMEGTFTNLETYRVKGPEMLDLFGSMDGAELEMMNDEVGILTVDTITFPELAKIAGQYARQKKIEPIAGPATRDITGRAVPTGRKYVSAPSPKDRPGMPAMEAMSQDSLFDSIQPVLNFAMSKGYTIKKGKGHSIDFMYDLGMGPDEVVMSARVNFDKDFNEPWVTFEGIGVSGTDPAKYFLDTFKENHAQVMDEVSAEKEYRDEVGDDYKLSEGMSTDGLFDSIQPVLNFAMSKGYSVKKGKGNSINFMYDLGMGDEVVMNAAVYLDKDLNEPWVNFEGMGVSGNDPASDFLGAFKQNHESVMDEVAAEKQSRDEEELEEVSKGEYIKQQDAEAEAQGKNKFKAFGQEFSTAEVDESEMPVNEAKELNTLRKLSGLKEAELKVPVAKEKYANSPDTCVGTIEDVITKRPSNDLHKPKKQHADKAKLGDNPLATEDEEKKVLESRLWSEYKLIKQDVISIK